MTCIHSNCNCLNNKISEIYSLRTNISSLQAQVSALQSQTAATNSQLANKQHQVEFTQNRLEYTQEQMTVTRVQLNESQNQINDLNNKLDKLKTINNDKDIELKRKDDEIKALKRNLEETQKGFLGEKLHSEQEKLETFAAELGIGLPKIQNLRKRYRELILAQEENRGNDIAVAKENIEATKEGLIERGINSNKVQKFCKKCKELVWLEVWIEKFQQQYYEVKQEVPVV